MPPNRIRLPRSLIILIVYLALEGGGYDPIVRNQLGIAVWWGVMLGLAIGALPLNRLRRGSWIAVGLLAAYVGWVALSLIWTRTTDASFEDIKAAYRRLAKANHPDAAPGDAEAAGRFQAVQAAYDVLKKAEERRAEAR